MSFYSEDEDQIRGVTFLMGKLGIFENIDGIHVYNLNIRLHWILKRKYYDI